MKNSNGTVRQFVKPSQNRHRLPSQAPTQLDGDAALLMLEALCSERGIDEEKVLAGLPRNVRKALRAARRKQAA